jgi:hypothetical protein
MTDQPTVYPTSSEWVSQNPSHAAEEIDRLRKRVAELESLAASWRDLALRAQSATRLNAEDIYAMTRRNR